MRPILEHDAMGFPVIRWHELRGLFAPGGPGLVRVECRIMKEAATGELLFVARGPVDYGQFEEASPWARLKSFASEPGDMYRSRFNRSLLELVVQKSRILRWLTGDSANVLWAQFEGTQPIHLNYAEASRMDLDALIRILNVEFVLERERYLKAAQLRKPIVAPTDTRIAAHDPTRTDWDGAYGRRKRIARAFASFATAGATGCVVVFLGYLAMLLVGVVKP